MNEEITKKVYKFTSKTIVANKKIINSHFLQLIQLQ